MFRNVLQFATHGNVAFNVLNKVHFKYFKFLCVFMRFYAFLVSYSSTPSSEFILNFWDLWRHFLIISYFRQNWNVAVDVFNKVHWINFRISHSLVSNSRWNHVDFFTCNSTFTMLGMLHTHQDASHAGVATFPTKFLLEIWRFQFNYGR